MGYIYVDEIGRLYGVLPSKEGKPTGGHSSVGSHRDGGSAAVGME